jgi:hypothetical protein
MALKSRNYELRLHSIESKGKKSAGVIRKLRRQARNAK